MRLKFTRGWFWRTLCLGVFSLLLALGINLAGSRPAVRAEDKEAAPTTTTAAAAPAGSAIIGRKIPNFVLPDTTGKQLGLADYAEKKVIVLFLTGTGCPIGNLYLPHLVEAQSRHGEILQIIGINANPGDTTEEIAEHAKEHKLNFPVVKDEHQTVLDLLGGTRLAEVFVLDERRVIRYHGRIDDRYTYTARKEKATREDAAEAVRQLVRGEKVTVPETEFEGCLITRVKLPKKGPITFHEDVEPILQQKCQNCHHEGTAAPFSLLTYDDAVNWSAMLKEVVLAQRMPPWHADPRFGHFANDRRLSDEQLRTLVSWVDQGTPEGDPQTAPPALTFAEGWRIDEPDVVFELPHDVEIPASGTMPYKYFVTPLDFKEDVWIEQAEARPGDRGVVHHIIVFAAPPGDKKGVEEKNWLVAFAPGDEPLRLPAGIGRKIPAGSRLIWQMHYTPNGKASVDRSQVAFKFCKTPPKAVTRVFGIDNHRFRIPPGAHRHEVLARHIVDHPVKLVSMMPHMHLRGKSFEYRAIYPDGRNEILLSVPQFDFNWQTSYRLAEPKDIPAGTKIECVAHYDNSAANPANPNPDETVRWGDQTWEEMMIGYLDFIPQ